MPQTNQEIGCLYESLMAHRIHQDQLLWSRSQTLYALQVAVIGGAFVLAFSLEKHILGGILLLFGVVITLLLLFITQRNWSNTKLNENIMDELAKRITPEDILSKGWAPRFTGPKICLSGHICLYIIIYLLMVTDFGLAVCLFLGWPSPTA